MGKIARLGSRSKAKRWPKGQSSNSNPETTKHRERATWMFFKDFAETSGITTEDLQRHDAMQSILPQIENIDIDKDQTDSNSEGTADTTGTFASAYSNCTNMSFNRFLSHFHSKSLMHKEMLAVLSAVTEVIKQNGGSETSTEYFAALMSTLEAVQVDTSVAATLSLLGMGIRTVPKNVLNAQFGRASKIFLQILTKYIEEENFLIIRHCLTCLSVLLRFQEAAVWSDSSTIQTLDAVLSFTIHMKSKIRKIAQHGICAILKASDIMSGENCPAYHPAAPEVAKYCVSQLNAACQPGGVTTILHTLTLLKDIIHHLPKSYIKTICEGLLSIMGLNNVLITSCCLQTLHGLFVSRPSEVALPSQRNAQIITALYDYQPPANDAQPTLAWLTVMQEAHCNLIQNSMDMCAAIVPRMLEKCIELWLCDKQEVISGISHTIKILLQECIGPLCITEEKIQKYKVIIDQIINMMSKTIKFEYVDRNIPFDNILHLIALLFQITKNTKNPQLLDILKTLAELRESYDFSCNAGVEYAVGAAIKALGPRLVLQTLPLQTERDAIKLERRWLLPLLKDCITHGSLSFFTDMLLPLAVICNKKSKEPVGGKTYEYLVPQIWAILPSLCNDANDVKENFKSIAKLLGTIISGFKDLRLSAMAALRKLITKATEINNSEDISELARFAKNYLPILFTLYTTKPTGTDEEGHRLATFDTIKIYLTITGEKLANELFDKALDNLEDNEADDFSKESIYDLIRLLIEYTDIERLKKCYQMCVPYIGNKTKRKEQKKAYRFIEGLCGSDKEMCKNFVQDNRKEIQKMIVASATKLIQTSKGARLKCLIHLVKNHPCLERTKFLEAVVPEAILSVKDINQKCRTSAYQLLNAIADKFLANPDYLQEYMAMIISGLAGGQKYCSYTLLALASLTYHYNGSLGIDNLEQILGHVCLLVVTPIREIAESALAYIKVYITVMPSLIIAKGLARIVTSLSEMDDDCKRHFRQKVRDIFTKLIRKYNISTISEMVPESDVILQKRLKNIHKVEEIKKKSRQLKKLKQSEKDKGTNFSAKRRPKSMEDLLADSEDFDDTDEEEQKKSKKKRTSRKEAWIRENEDNIVDLIDPSTSRNITTTNPESASRKTSGKQWKKEKDYGFKMAPDGRIIIKDNNQKDDDSEETSIKRKRLSTEDETDDDDSDDGEEDKNLTVSGNRKRKHSTSSDTMSSKGSVSSKYQAGGSGIHRALKVQKVEDTAGSEYRANKARGDMKKKGKPDPYAYVPLTRAALNKRKKKKMAMKLRGIAAGAKKGTKGGRISK